MQFSNFPHHLYNIFPQQQRRIHSSWVSWKPNARHKLLIFNPLECNKFSHLCSLLVLYVSSRIRDTEWFEVYLSTYKRRNSQGARKNEVKTRGGKILVYPNFNNIEKQQHGKEEENSFNKREMRHKKMLWINKFVLYDERDTHRML